MHYDRTLVIYFCKWLVRTLTVLLLFTLTNDLFCQNFIFFFDFISGLPGSPEAPKNRHFVVNALLRAPSKLYPGAILDSLSHYISDMKGDQTQQNLPMPLAY